MIGAALGLSLAAQQALTAGAISGGIAAGVPLAGRGIAALTPAAREQRKLDKQMREDAIKAYERGKKRGYGPSRQARTKMTAEAMQQYDNQMAASQNNLRRQEASLGFGRSGQLAGVRQDMSKQRADALGRTQGQVEDRARSIADQRRAMVLAQLGRERSLEAQKNAERAQFIGNTLQTAAGVGIGVGMGTKQAVDAGTWKVPSGDVAAATGASPETTMDDLTNRERRQWNRYDRAVDRGIRAGERV